VASLTGKVRYLAQIHTHLNAWSVELLHFIKSHVKWVGWDHPLPIPEQAMVELVHWSTRSKLIPVLINLWAVVELANMGDAGPYGFGYEGLKEEAGAWSSLEIQQSQNWKEIKCWANQVEANLDQLVGTV
jgi:hypothetical protein